MTCERIEKCGFFKKYQDTKNLACKGFVNQFCNGPHMNECKRKEYAEKNGCPPADDMMPNGVMIAHE